MLSAAIAYQVLQQESPQTIEKVNAVLEKHPCARSMGGIEQVAIRKSYGGHQKIIFAIST
jgi:hypothetical protein